MLHPQGGGRTPRHPRHPPQRISQFDISRRRSANRSGADLVEGTVLEPVITVVGEDLFAETDMAGGLVADVLGADGLWGVGVGVGVRCKIG